MDIAKELDALSDQEVLAQEAAFGRSKSRALGSKATSSTNLLSPAIAARPSSPAESDSLDPSDEESELHTNVVEVFNQLSINPVTYRYHGKSSSLVFLRAAKGLKDQSKQPDPYQGAGKAGENIRRSQKLHGPYSVGASGVAV